MINTINAALTSVSDSLFSLVSIWPPIVVLIVISVLVGVVMAIVFRFTSQQQQLRRVADLSRAQVLAIKLFKDDLGNIFVSLGRLFRYTGLRLWYSLPPALVMFVPFVLLLIQMARWYEHLPIVPGESAVLEMQLSDGAWPRVADLEVSSSDEIIIETLPVRDDEEHVVDWRIRAKGSQPATIQWRLGDERGEKRVTVAHAKQAFCAVDWRVPGSGWWDRVMNPGEGGLASDSAVQGINLCYIDQQRETPLFGLNFPWWLTFLIVSMLAAIVVRPLVRVQF